MTRDAEIFEQRQQGARVVDLARKYSLCKSRITAIVKEQSMLREGGADLPRRLEAARLALLKARAENEELAATLSELRLRRARHDLIPRAEVREVFSRVFAAYRQATREVERRYGPNAARLLIDAERSALTH